MITITLADGSQKQFSKPISVYELAADIGPGPAKAALAAKIDERLVDTSYILEADAKVQIITSKDDAGLEIIRHSAAHLMAHAVKILFPNAQVTIGPVIENGFYYDFAFERGFTPEDMEKIEAKMSELAKADYKIQREELSRDAAIKLFAKMGEQFKVKIIEDIPAGETLSAYRQDDFIDLCRGPHVPSTGKLKAFKLTKLAGAYWRGDSNNEMLQRIYGTAWADKKSLKEYLHRLEEAEKRDHRVLAKKMHLFHQQPEAPGMIFWHANGYALVDVIHRYIRQQWRESGYQEIKTPQLVDIDLWELSGHKEKFGDDMFVLDVDNREYAIKPMSCPCHVQVFKQGLTSYRDLPIRLAEFGNCHRNEPSGTLHGLMRIRNFVQDDGHIFCTEDQIHGEVLSFIEQLHAAYRDFGFIDVIHKLSTRPEKRVGSDAVWDKAEKALADALDSSNLDWDILPGEGAFYGPKIEFSLRDTLGRVWQCGTIQVDFSMPERLGAYYISESGDKHTPVMLHRAILGSVERFTGMMLEHYAGHLPLWLAPVQVVAMTITDRQQSYVTEIVEKLQKMGIRAISDLRNEKIGFKIREHTISRVPYLLVIGDREMADQTVAVRTSQGGQVAVLDFEKFVAKVDVEIDTKAQTGGINN
ncbi:MAG: threonine--tRNA ligase [Gammaproteobacteria bacterium]|nr:threonine--tRNA ligase [Gammaproteobacteria bacterium]